MKSYLHLLTKTIARKFGPYLIIILGLFIFSLLTILQIRAFKGSELDGKVLASITTFDKFVPFVFAGLFSASVITHIFKEGEIDGLELIIVSKPITRKEILLSKFLLTLILIITYQLFMFIGYYIITLFDTKASSSIKMNWVLSLVVGGFIIQLIFSAIIILLASAFGKIGTIVMSILIAAITPIISYTISPLGKGQAFELRNSVVSQFRSFNLNQYDKEEVSSVINENEIYNFVTNEEEFNNYQEGRWYQKAAPFDIWYQWGRFYDIFLPNNNNDFSAIQKWDKTNLEIKKSNYSFMLNNKNYIFVVSASFQVEQFKKDIEFVLNGIELFANNQELVKKFINPTQNDETPKFNDRLKIINLAINSPTLDPKQLDDISALPEPDVNRKFDIIPIYQALQEKLKLDDTNLDMSGVNNLQDWNLYQIDDKLPNMVVTSDYISNQVVIIIWLIITIALIGTSIIIYARRDFK